MTVAIKKKINNSVLEYIGDEMDGVSDDYAYILTDMSQPKTYVRVGYEQHLKVVTPQLKETKISKDEMSHTVSELDKRRTVDTTAIKQQMEQNQLQAVLDHLKRVS